MPKDSRSILAILDTLNAADIITKTYVSVNDILYEYKLVPSLNVFVIDGEVMCILSLSKTSISKYKIIGHTMQPIGCVFTLEHLSYI